jgi:acyl-CoA thioesterase I
MRDGFRLLKLSFMALVCAAAVSCGSGDTTPVHDPGPAPGSAIDVRVLALGDSYTAGQSVPRAKSWPRQLAEALLADSIRVTDLTVFARTGWTTTDLLDTLATDAAPQPHDFVTLQIGVNNQFGRLPFSVFQSEFPQLVERAVELAGGNRERVLVLSIPDYSVTPVGSRIDPDRVRTEIEGYNEFLHAEAESLGVASIDITGFSLLALEDPRLVASDGLHFSGKMYALWVEVLRPLVADMLLEYDGTNTDKGR